MKQSLRWVLLKTHWRTEEKMDECAFKYALAVERACKAQHLYFCRYSGVSSEHGVFAWTEIKMQTAASDKKIGFVRGPAEAILWREITPCDPCSLAHSFAFQAMKHIGDCRDDRDNRTTLLDVWHWMANMGRLTYSQEVAAHCDMIAHFTRQKDQQEVAFKKLLLAMVDKNKTNQEK